MICKLSIQYVECSGIKIYSNPGGEKICLKKKGRGHDPPKNPLSCATAVCPVEQLSQWDLFLQFHLTSRYTLLRQRQKFVHNPEIRQVGVFIAFSNFTLVQAQ